MESKLYLIAKSNLNALHIDLQREIYREFYRFVYPSIYYKVRDHALTEDIIQESFFSVVRHMPNLDDDDQIKRWIKVVVRNTMYTFLRKYKKKRNEIDLGRVYLNEEEFFLTNSAPSLEEEIEAKALRDAIARALRDLKPEYRIILEMRWKKELSYKEMAEELGITELALKNKLHRAREAVKRRIQKEWGDSI